MLDLTPLFRLLSKQRLRRLAALDPVAEQERQLLKLLRQAQRTQFGQAHDFARIGSVAEFQQRVPLRRYEDFWRDYWQPAFPLLDNVTWPGRIPYFAVTSGTTTGKTKYIPCSRAMIRANQRAAVDVLHFHLACHPDSRPLAGKSFLLGGSTALQREAAGVYSGDLSGIATKTAAWWMRLYRFPPLRLALLDDWDRKLELLARRASQEKITLLTGTPSWLLILLDRLQNYTVEGGAGRLLPDLQLLIHGGVAWAPYRRRFADYLSGVATREVYPASEGFVALADRGEGEGLRLCVDNGLFFEFVPVAELDSANPTRHWLATLETGVNYAVVLSTCAGLWGYILGDTVRFVERKPPRLLITGRTSYMLSAFGEHLIAEEIEAAVAVAAAKAGLDVTDFCVGAVFPEAPDKLGRHVYILEFARNVSDSAAVSAHLATSIDADLMARNDDYRAHRTGDTGMASPRVHIVPPGSFADWMRARGRLGGQNKVPRIVNDPELFGELRAWMRVLQL